PARRRAALAAAPLIAVALTACQPQAATPTRADTPAAVTAADHPMTVESCGTSVTVPEPPGRIVTIKSSATEMVLALGAGDRLVGAAFLDGPVPEHLADAAADLPVMSDQLPSGEAVLEVEPDLVYAGWESNLTAEGAGDRGTLASLGVATFVSPAACKEPAHQPDPMTFDLLFEEITQVGALLGTPEEAADLVAEHRDALAAVDPDPRGLTALWYSSGTDIPYVGAGIGTPQMVMDAVGLTNVAADVHDTWTSYAWENVADADPDVIVLVDAAWNTAESKREMLRENPATANLTAVVEERYLVVPFPATEAGVRTVPATVELASRLADLELPGATTDGSTAQDQP
ncbi:iron transporter, partial [Cellulomonas bogoriensis 69B4 = DSM 16987]